MCCDQLVCAACGGRVSDASCSTCVASRVSVHSAAGLRPEVVVLLVLLVLLVGALAR